MFSLTGFIYATSKSKGESQHCGKDLDYSLYKISSSHNRRTLGYL